MKVSSKHAVLTEISQTREVDEGEGHSFGH